MKKDQSPVTEDQSIKAQFVPFDLSCDGISGNPSVFVFNVAFRRAGVSSPRRRARPPDTNTCKNINRHIESELFNY